MGMRRQGRTLMNWSAIAGETSTAWANAAKASLCRPSCLSASARSFARVRFLPGGRGRKVSGR